MEYRPNAAARALTTAKTRTVVFAVHRHQFPLGIDPFYPGIMRGLEETLAAEHYGVMLLTLSDDDIQAGPASLPVLQEGRVDALVAAGPDIPAHFILAAASNSLPVILVDNALRETAIPTVTADDSGGCRAATCHLVDVHGHSSIALLRGTSGWVSSDDRAAGYCEAMDAAGLEPRVVSVDATTIETGAAALVDVLGAWPETTAVVAVNDAMAIGAMRQARELGRRLPEDLAVVGFDDISWAALSDPPLTTVRVPIVQIGRKAGRVLLDHFDDVVTVSSRTTLATELMVRTSCGCAPSPAVVVPSSGEEETQGQA
jgi:DNA-binding LacI/PurR family transcriptional regulator